MLFNDQMKLSHSYNMLFRFIVDRPVPQPYPVHVKVPVYQTQFVEKHGMYNYQKMSIRHYSICGSLCSIRFLIFTVDRPVFIEKPTYIEKHVPVPVHAPVHVAHAPAPYFASTPAPLYGGAPIGHNYGGYGHLPQVEHYHH